MKTGEWIIKLISYVICLSAVCAGFAYKEKQADAALNAYLKRAEEERTENLYCVLLRLKEGMRGCVSEIDDGSASEISYCCKAAADLIYGFEPGRESDGLRAYLIRIKNVCDMIQNGKDAADADGRAMLSELYTRLTAMETVLRDGSMSAGRLIKELSSGLPENKKDAPQKARISRSRAEKYAENDMPDLRLTRCERYNGRFIFSSSGSFTALDETGKTLVKSRTVTYGEKRYNAAEASEKAKEYISDVTEQPSEAELICDAFGILYFRVRSGEKEYPVGIDKTDGKVVFTVICR